jgi:hypothetical protein
MLKLPHHTPDCKRFLPVEDPDVAESRPAPAFTGLVVHRDRDFGYSLFVPDGWLRLDLEGNSGVFYAPDPDDPLTGLAVDAQDLGTAVRPDDLATLRSGFLAGLRGLPDCRIERHEAEAIGQLITLEARHTYRDGDAVRKRWVRLLYQGRTQVRLVARAATVEAFEYWEPMFYEAIRTVRFGDWWTEAHAAPGPERAFEA